MKTSIIKISFLACIAVGVMSACNPSPKKEAEKVEEAKEDLQEAKEDLEQARLDSINDYYKFKEEADARFAENERQIALLKEKAQLEKKEVREKYEKELNELTEKNAQLKSRVEENRKNAKDKWEAFKLNFNQEMDQLGKSLSAMVERNKTRK